ncbi:putative holin [Serratia marcescens]
MAEPLTISTGVATGTVTGIAVVGMVPGADPGVMIGAFAGAVIFVLSAADFPLWKRAMLFVVSMLVGMYAAELSASIVASLLTTLLRESITVQKPVGAVLAAAAAVRILMMFSARPSSNGSIFDRFRGGGEK